MQNVCLAEKESYRWKRNLGNSAVKAGVSAGNVNAITQKA